MQFVLTFNIFLLFFDQDLLVKLRQILHLFHRTLPCIFQIILQIFNWLFIIFFVISLLLLQTLNFQF